MKILKKITSLLMAIICLLSLIACGSNSSDGIKRVVDTRNLSAFEYSRANITGIDSLGRTVRIGDERNNDKVGMFYFLWNGFHTTGIYDITDLLAENPNDLWDSNGTSLSPLNEFHYWGEPLYGYYCAEDPWVLTRHAELLTMAGIDYLVFDTTNSFTYNQQTEALLKVFDNFRQKGYNVPKVAFYVNSNSANTITNLYNKWYKKPTYTEMWYTVEGKPFIVVDTDDLTTAQYELYNTIFHIRESQWPQYSIQRNAFAWMDWQYPQTNFDGQMVVSLAQHPGCKMSEQAATNKGRGYDYSTFKNDSSLVAMGSNFQGQWDNVFANRQDVNDVFVTGWNEWIAVKSQANGQVYFVDTFNEEYSRDIEMTKETTKDNYYMQLVDNVKKYRYSQAVNYLHDTSTVNIFNGAGLEKATHYIDFAGDAIPRDYVDAAHKNRYVDNSNRNDITDIKVIHDADNIYFYVQTLNEITAYQDGDLGWMNILINVGAAENTFEGYSYVINRKPNGEKTSLEKSLGGYNWELANEIDYVVSGNTITFSIPRTALQLDSKNVTFTFKVADNVTNPEDIMNYYVSGDSAPIGRLSYSYGY